RGPYLGKHETRNQQQLPTVAPQVGDDAAIVDQRFPAGRGIAETDDLDTLQRFLWQCARGMRAEHSDMEIVDQPLCELVHEARLVITHPARVGGGQHKQVWADFAAVQGTLHSPELRSLRAAR